MRICSPQLEISAVTGQGGGVYEYELLSRLAADPAFHFLFLTHPDRPFELPGRPQVEHVHFKKGRYAGAAFAKAAIRLHAQTPLQLFRIFSARFVGLAGLILRLRLPGVKVVLHHHHLDPGFYNWLTTALAVKASHAVITVSEFSKADLVSRFRIPAERVSVVYNGVAEHLFGQTTAPPLLRPPESPDRKVVLFVGALKARKNLAFLLESFGLVLSVHPGTLLVLAGIGEQEQELKALASRKGLENQVLFTGFLSEQEKVAWLRRATVFASASLLEGFGLNVAEAMAVGLPVIVSDRGALPEIVTHEQTGLVASVSRTEAFAEALVRLLQDAELRAKLGRQAQLVASTQFRWDRAARETAAIYRRIVGGHA